MPALETMPTPTSPMRNTGAGIPPGTGRPVVKASIMPVVAAPGPEATDAKEEAEIKRLLSRREEFACLLDAWEWCDILRERRLGGQSVREKWLVKAHEDNPAEFSKRAKLTNHAPKTPVVESRISGAVFDEAPAIEAPEALDDFVAHPRRNSAAGLDEFVKRATRIAMYKGQAAALIDRPAVNVNSDAPLSIADAQRLGIDKPYVVLIQPENVLDWRLDDDQQPAYVRITSGPLPQTDGSTVETVREISLAGIQPYTVTVDPDRRIRRLAKGILVPLRGNLAAARRLPVVFDRCDPIDGVRGVPTLGDAAVAELRLFNALSSLIWVLWKAGNPLLWIKTLEDLSSLGVGVNHFIKLRPGQKNADGSASEAEELGYCQVDASVIPNLEAECEAAARALMDQLGMSVRANQSAQPGGAQASSGVSVAYDFELGEANTLKEVAAAAQRFAEDLLVTVALEMGVIAKIEDAEGVISAKYSTDFSPRTNNAAVALAGQARNLFGPDHPTTIYALNLASAAIMADASQDELKEARDANEGGAYQPPAPDLMGGVPGFKPKPNLSRPVPAGSGGDKPAAEKPKE